MAHFETHSGSGVMERSVPASRLSRLALMGRLVGGLAGGAAREGVKRLARGERSMLAPLLLTADNAQRLASRLSEMRGAAMKVGQLLSMDSGQFLPPELSQVLARLRDNAHQMPMLQVAKTLNRAWGEGWERRFERFSFTPIAAASIGQVHEALLKDGRRLAIKVQYPGIRRSIDSDVDNVMTLLRFFKLLPEGLDLDSVIDDAKVQLHREADYQQEASRIAQYAYNLADDKLFVTPEAVAELTTREVLAMTFLDGQPIETVADLPIVERDSAATALLALALREVFDWGLVQTDPNFANYLYDNQRKQIQLLDFGATRDYSNRSRDRLRRLLTASIEGDDADIVRSAIEVGYLGEADPMIHRRQIVKLLRTVSEPVRSKNGYSFGDTGLSRRMSDILVEMRLQSRFYQLPPPEILFLHRKLGGLYLLLTRLRAKVSAHQIVSRYLGGYT